MLVLSEKGRKQRIELLAFSPSGELLLAAGNGAWLDVWSPAKSIPPERYFESQDYYGRAFAASFIDGDRAVVAACGSGGLRVQPITSSSTFELATHPAEGYLQRLVVSPCGRRVIGLNFGYSSLVPGRLAGYQSWITDDGRRFRPDWSLSVPDYHEESIAYSPDGQRIVAAERSDAPAGERETTLQVRDAVTGRGLGFRPCPYLFVEQLVFSPTGQYLLARAGMAVVIWTEPEPVPTCVLHNDNRKHFTDIAFHPADHYLAATSNDETVKLYDTATWRVAKTFTWNVGRLRSVAFSPDGTRAAVGSDKGQIVVWDVDL